MLGKNALSFVSSFFKNKIHQIWLFKVNGTNVRYFDLTRENVESDLSFEIHVSTISTAASLPLLDSWL